MTRASFKLRMSIIGLACIACILVIAWRFLPHATNIDAVYHAETATSIGIQSLAFDGKFKIYAKSEGANVTFEGACRVDGTEVLLEKPTPLVGIYRTEAFSETEAVACSLGFYPALREALHAGEGASLVFRDDFHTVDLYLSAAEPPITYCMQDKETTLLS